jgi:hypothetical protein
LYYDERAGRDVYATVTSTEDAVPAPLRGCVVRTRAYKERTNHVGTDDRANCGTCDGGACDGCTLITLREFLVYDRQNHDLSCESMQAAAAHATAILAGPQDHKDRAWAEKNLPHWTAQIEDNTIID